MAALRIRLLGGLVALGALYGAWLWVRDSPVFAVQQVQVSGLRGASADVIRGRLEQAARAMTTTHVDSAKLRSVIAPYAAVSRLKVDTRLPHGISISVTEQLPAMALVVGARRLPVAPDGTLLRGALPAGAAVPDVGASAIPPGGVVRAPAQLRALELLDIAPEALRARIWRVSQGPMGLTGYLHAGPQLLFGDTTRLHAKWAAASRVLQDPSSRGARYIDLRVPDRPAAQVADSATGAQPKLAGPQAASAGGPSTGAAGNAAP